MSLPHAAFQWLAETPLSQYFNGSHYLWFGGFMAVHLIGIALLVGTSLLIDLRLLGLGLRVATPTQVLRTLRPWLLGGLGVVLASGAWLLLADPLKYYANPVFRLKALLLVLAITTQLGLFRASTESLGSGLKAVAGAGILLWFATIIAGRWVGLL